MRTSIVFLLLALAYAVASDMDYRDAMLVQAYREGGP